MINFGWLAVWVLSPGWFSRKVEVCDFCQVLSWNRRACSRGVRAVPRMCIVYLGIWLTPEEKSRKNLSQGNRRALGWTVPNAIRYSTWPLRAIASRPPCHLDFSRQATGSTLGQRKYLPSSRTRRFPTSASLESKLAFSPLMWSVNSGTTRSPCIYLLLKYCTRGHQ